MLVLCALPAMGAGMSTPASITTPEGYTVVSASSWEDFKNYSTTNDVAFKVDSVEGGVVLDGLSTNLKGGSGTWYITSSDAGNLSSLSISNASTRIFSFGSLIVENLGSLTASGISYTEYSDYNGGALGYLIGSNAFNNNGSLSFSDNSRYYSTRGNGGVFLVSGNGSLAFTSNNDVSFDGNTASSTRNDTSGGAIYGKRGAVVSFADNKNLSFTDNKVFTVQGSNAYVTAYAPMGGALYIAGSEEGGSVTNGEGGIAITGNDSVVFQGNISEANFDEQSAYDCYGGAIYTGKGTSINISENDSLKFIANKAQSIAVNGTYSSGNTFGGALAAGAGATVQLNANDEVLFQGNESLSSSEGGSSSTVYGGAIYIEDNATLELNNNGTLSLIGNRVASETGRSTSYHSAYGGAIHGAAGSSISLNGNGTLLIQGNTAYSSGEHTYGAAISADSISISGNTDVTISGNKAESIKGTSWGGAIYAENVTIAGNGSVLIENNAEIDSAGVRMLAIRANSGLELSAGAGQTIRVHDAVLAPGEVKINASENGSMGGQVILDASYVPANLEAHLDRPATADEIRTSSTNWFGATTQQSGTLQLQGGSRVIAGSYTIDSTADVTATLSLDSGKFRTESMTTSEGATLSFAGDSYALMTNATLGDSTTLAFTPGDGYAVRLAGDINAGELVISVDSTNMTRGESYCLFTLAAGSSMAWDESKVTLKGVSSDDARLVWNKGSLYLDFGVTEGGTQQSMQVQEGFVLSEECREVNQHNVSQLSTLEGSQKYVLTESIVVDNQNLTFDTLIGHYELTSADAATPVNLTIQNMVEGGLGGRDAASDIRIHHLNEVLFLSNHGENTGTSIYLHTGSTAEISDNRSVCFASRPEELTAEQKPQIYVSNQAYLLMQNNDKLAFIDNYGRNGAAICASQGSKVEIAHNKDVEFTGNGYPRANNNSYEDYGGAIYVSSNGAELLIHDNEKVSFNDNICEKGGAINVDARSSLRIYDNAEVSFSRNGRPEEGSGGAIRLGREASLEISGNTVVTFDENETRGNGGAICAEIGSTVTLKDNDTISFTGNSSASGAAIYMDDGTTLVVKDNKNVLFDSSNKSAASNGSTSGAIYSYNDSYNNEPGNIVILSNNENLKFTGNEGGGVRMTNFGGSIHIQNNDNTWFEGNYSLDTKGNYTLRAMKLSTMANAAERGKVTDIVISAAQGKSVSFQEGISITGSVDVRLNENYVNDNNQSIAQTGDIVFSAAKVASNLAALKGDTPVTADEIKNSSTFHIAAETKLYGGRLCVEDGAIFTGNGLQAMEGSAATVLVNNATIDHTGYDLVFNSGTKLEVIGKSSVKGNLVMKAGSAMVVDAATMSLSGTTSIGESVSLSSRNDNASIAKLAMASDGITGSAADSGMQDVTLAVGNATYFLSGVTLNNVELNTSANTAFSLSDVAVLSGSSFSLGDSGSVVMRGKGAYDIGTATAIGSRITLADDWTGTVKMTGSTMAGLNIDTLAKGADSSVELSGVNGYLSQANGSNAKTYATNIILTNNGDAAAWTINNGWNGDTRTFTGEVSGDGTIKRSSWRGTVQNMVFAGDTSQWTGAFEHAVDSGSSNGATVVTNLTFNGTTEINAEISTNGKGELNVTLDDANIKARSNEVRVNKQMTVTSLTLTEGTQARFQESLTSEGQSTLNKGASLNLAGTCTLSGLGENAGFFTGTVLDADSAEGGSMRNMNVSLSAASYEFKQIDLSNVLFASSIVSTLTLNEVSFGEDCSFDVGAEGSIVLAGAVLTLSTPTLDAENDGVLMLDCSNIFHCTASGDMVISLGLTREELKEAGYRDISIDFGSDVDYSELMLSIEGLFYVGVQDGAATFSLVPEPATATLSLLALAALAARRRRR